MIKPYITLLLLAIPALLFSQQPRTVAFNGKVYQVFPYKIQNNNNSPSSDAAILGINDNVDAPWFPGTLPNGEYIAYYGSSSIRWGDYTEFAFDTTIPAITFSIRDNKKEGMATFYYADQKGVPYLKGSYVNDLKEGIWYYTAPKQPKIKTIRLRQSSAYYMPVYDFYDFESSQNITGNKTFEYKSGILSGSYMVTNVSNKQTQKGTYLDATKHGIWETYTKDKLNVSVSYDHGVRQGPFVFYKADGTSIKGNFTASEPSGTWEFYSEKGILREKHHISVSDSTMDDKDSGRCYSNNYMYDRLYNREGYEKNVIIERYDKTGHIYDTEYLYKGHGRIETYKLTDKNGYDLAECRLLQTHPSLGNIYEYIDYGNKGKRTRKSVYACNDYVETELGTEYYNEETGTLSSKHTSKDYYLLQNTTLPDLLLIDSSTIYTVHTKKQKTRSVTETYLHTTTNHRFSKNYNISESGQKNMTLDFELYTEGDRLVAKRRSYVGKLMITDTAQYSLQYDSSQDYNSDYNLGTTILDESNIYTYYPFYSYGEAGVEYYTPNHQTGQVYWDGVPYDGPLSVFHISFTESKEPVAEYKIYRDLTGTEQSHEIIIRVSSNISDYGNAHVYESPHRIRRNRHVVKRQRKDITDQLNAYFPSSREFYFYNGKWDGVVKYYNRKNQTLYDAQFSQGYKHGTEHTFHATQLQYTYMPVGVYDENSGGYSQTLYYKKGLLNGTIIHKYPYTGEPLSVITYENGLLNGENLYFDEQQQMRFKAVFKNDTLNGDLYVYENGYVQAVIPFKNGFLDGHYRDYIRDYESGSGMAVSIEPGDDYDPFADPRQVMTTDIRFKHGLLYDTGYYYFNEGGLKTRVIYALSDSISMWQFSKTGLNNGTYEFSANTDYENDYYQNTQMISYYSENMSVNPMSFEPSLPGRYSYFYKSGIKSQEGVVKDNYKSGWWQYWNESGNLMKEIEYTKGYLMDPLHGTDTIHYTGKIKLYYPTGSFMGEGYVTDEFFSYECVQDADISYEDIYYTSFFDRNGKPVFVNYTGTVQDFHLNGNRRMEGLIQNGKRESTWKFFDPDGNLQSIGNYLNGNKDGRWLEGDLTGINYLDNQCYNNDQMFEIQKRLRSKELNFRETIWKNGDLIKQSDYNLTKD